MSLDNTYFEECDDEPEDKFTQTPNELVRDKTISAACRMMIIFITSHKKPWKVNFSHVLASFDEKIGKEKLYKLIAEARAAGYISRTSFIEKGLKRFKYKISKFPRFKICLPYSGLPHPAFPDPAEPDTLKNTLKKEYSSSSLRSEEERRIYKDSPEIQIPVSSPPPPPPSEAVGSLVYFFLSKIRERNPNHKEPNMKKWCAEMDKLLRIDKRDPEEVRRVIEWASTAKWYSTAVLSPEKLRKDYDDMFIKIRAEEEENRVRTNRAYALSVKEQYPDKLRGMSFSSTYVVNAKAGKELRFDMNVEAFKRAFVSMFGGTYHDED